MKNRFYIFLLILSAFTSVALGDFDFFQIQKYSCVTSTGIRLEYDAALDMNHVQSEWMSVGKTFYADGAKFNTETKETTISFTGHRPSAGPSYDPWESDFSIQISGRLSRETSQDVRGDLLRSVSFGPYLKMSSIQCKIILP